MKTKNNGFLFLLKLGGPLNFKKTINSMYVFFGKIIIINSTKLKKWWSIYNVRKFLWEAYRSLYNIKSFLKDYILQFWAFIFFDNFRKPNSKTKFCLYSSIFYSHFFNFLPVNEENHHDTSHSFFSKKKNWNSKACFFLFHAFHAK